MSGWFGPGNPCNCCDETCPCELNYVGCVLYWWCTALSLVRIRDVDTDTIVATGLHGTILEPTIGHTYRIELCCGGEDCTTWVNGNEQTISSYSSDQCYCCDNIKPDYVVLSGFTGCCTALNGTWVLTESTPCGFGKVITLTVSATPCDSGACLTTTYAGETYQHHTKVASVTVTLPSTTSGSITITASVGLETWRRRFGFCALVSSLNAAAFHYTAPCDVIGEATLSSYSETVAESDTPVFCCDSTPGTANVYMVKR